MSHRGALGVAASLVYFMMYSGVVMSDAECIAIGATYGGLCVAGALVWSGCCDSSLVCGFISGSHPVFDVLAAILAE